MPHSQIEIVAIESTARRQALRARSAAIGFVSGMAPTRRESTLQRIALDVLEASRQWALRSVIKPEDWAIVFRASRNVPPASAIKAWDAFKSGLQTASVPHSRQAYPVTGSYPVTNRVGIVLYRTSVQHAMLLIQHERLAPRIRAAKRILDTLLIDIDVLEDTISRREREGASGLELRAARVMLARMGALARMKQGRLPLPQQRLGRIKNELWLNQENGLPKGGRNNSCEGHMRPSRVSVNHRQWGQSHRCILRIEQDY